MSIRKYIPNKYIKLAKHILGKKEIRFWTLKEREEGLKKLYKSKMGYELNLQYPSLFSEKIQWLKLYYEDDRLSTIVDKVSFKEYINNALGRGGYVANCIDVWASPNDVDFSKITADKFVVKSNAASDGKFLHIITNKEPKTLKKLEKEIKENWFDTSRLLINSFCRAYYDVKPKVLIEEYLESFDNNTTGKSCEYKVFCFNGDPQIIYYMQKSMDECGTEKISFLDKGWNPLNVQYGHYKMCDAINIPNHKNEMMDISRKLSKGFPFARIDFIEGVDKLYLTEITFYPGGGLTKYNPPDFDKELGDLLVLPNEEA